MKQRYTHLVIVLPCHSLEDFPTHYRGPDAASLLACWTGLWHPALIESAQQLPTYQPAEFGQPQWNQGFSHFDSSGGDDDSHQDSTEQDLEFPLLVIPRVAQSLVDSQLLMEVQQSGVVLEDPTSRSQLVESAVQSSSFAAELADRVEADQAADFFALGYAYLQVQLMTRQLRYSSNLDDQEFAKRVLAAAAAACGDVSAEDYEDRLTACFDLLLEEKNAYYPVEPQLCDIVLTANTTLGKRLTEQLNFADHPWNLAITGQLCDQLQDQHPESVAALREQIDQEKLTIIGGLQDELPDWLLPTEAVLHQLQQGRQTLERVTGQRAKVFLRRRFGLHPALPHLLNQTGFLGAIHATMDQGKFPRSPNGVMRWHGDDDESILALGDSPLDANDAGSFLRFGIRLGEMIDSAHMATALFVRWPSQACETFQDLQRITRYSPLFGDFVKLDSMFESLYDPGYGDTFAADEYRPAYFQQSIANGLKDPVSGSRRYWQRWAQLTAFRNLVAQACIAHGIPDSIEALEQLQQTADSIQARLEASRVLTPAGTAKPADSEQETDRAIDQLLASAAIWWRTGSLKIDPQAALESTSFIRAIGMASEQTIAQRRVPSTAINPTSFRRRIHLPLPGDSQEGSIKAQPPLQLVSQQAQQSHWIVDFPGSGSLALNADKLGRGNVFKSDPLVAEEQRLQNEWFQVAIDPATGGVRSVILHGGRQNLMSQRLAARIPSPGQSSTSSRRPAKYADMVADSIRIVEQTPLTGTIESTGKLVADNVEIATFRQQTRLVRGLSRIFFRVELEPTTELSASPHHYLCSRLAWKDEGAKLTANSLDARHPVGGEWIHSTQYLTIGDEHTVTLLTGGLPYHRRANRRMLDSILICHGETSRVFEFAIDVDQKYGLAACQDYLSPVVLIDDSKLSASGIPVSGLADSWRLHLDSRNAIVTWCEAFVEPGLEQGADRRLGLRLRIRETEGRLAKCNLRCQREIEEAKETDFLDQETQTLEVHRENPNRIQIDIPGFGFRQLKLYLKP